MSNPSREWNPRAHGNIYTPHAGQMIIQVARESGLQSRTFVLSQGQVRVLRFLFRSRASRMVGVIAAVLIVLVISQAARVPLLTYRIAHMQHDAARLDTLEKSLAELQKRYDQVQRMLGATTSADAFPAAAGDTLQHRARVVRARREATEEPAVAPEEQPVPDSTAVVHPPSKSADPMD